MEGKLELALIAAAKAFLATYSSAAVVTKEVPQKSSSALTYNNGVPICSLHGKKLAVSKNCRDEEKDYYYCQTKDDVTGKWCSTKAGKTSPS